MKADGEPAFPNQYHENHDPSHYHGMSIRDWLAGMAMQGILMCQYKQAYTAQHCAEEAYAQADAMLAERSKV
jgi:hypothetical protein